MSPASAEPTPPVVSYLDYATSGARPLGSALLAGTPATTLSPSGYLAYTFDVSDDGNTLLVGLARGSTATVAQDRTYGLLLVRRDGVGTTTTILSSAWDTTPVLSPDGATAWWMTDGRLWKHTAGITTLVTATVFQPKPGDVVAGFSVSPDGSDVAAVYREDGVTVTTTRSRVLALDLTSLTDAAFADVTVPLPLYREPPAWTSATTLLLPYDDNGATKDATVTLTTGAGTIDTTQVYGSPGLYDVQQLGATWWVWRDEAGTSQFASTTDLSTVATASFTSFPLGPVTGWYRMSDVTPPAITPPVNRTPTRSHLIVSAALVKYGSRVVYDTWADYLLQLPGQPVDETYWVARGTLQYSINGTTWKNLVTTSWAHPVPWPRSTAKGAGYTQVLTRNTWFRWVYPADWFTTSSLSKVVLVRVVPIVKAKVAVSGRYRTVYGTASRVGGAAVLYRVVGTRLVKVATTTLTSRGAYSFGKRALSRGTYKVLTVADKYWYTGSVAVYVR